MSKYQKFAKQLAQTICNIMNLFYKYKEAELFRVALLNHLSSLYFSTKENTFILPEGRIKPERMDHLEKGAHIGKPREIRREEEKK